MNILATDNNKRQILLFGTISTIVYLIMVLVTIPTIREHMNGIEIFDLRPMGYSVDEAKEILSAISVEGKHYYQIIQLPLDFIYPMALGLFLSSLLVVLSKRKLWLHRFLWVPLTITFFDYMENISVYFMLNGITNDWFIRLASIFSILKSMSTVVILSAMLCLGLDTLIRHIRKGIAYERED